MRHFASKLGLAVMGLMGAGVASAEPVDLTELTGAIDLGTVGTSVVTVMAGLAAVYVAMKAGRLLLSALRGS